MNLQTEITQEQIKNLEKKLLNKEFQSLETLIQKLNKKNFNHPAVKIIYANAKVLKMNPTLIDKKIAFDIFIDTYKANTNFVPALLNACVLCFEIKEYSKILDLLKVFVKKNKYNSKIYETLYKIYAVLGDVDSAIIILKKVVTIETENLKAWSSLIFCLNYSENYSQKEYINFSKKFSKNIKIYNEEKAQLLNLRSQRIKLGFLFSYFKENSINGFLNGFINNIDKNIFEVVAFNLSNVDLKIEGLKKNFDGWFDVYNLDNLSLINFIRNKNVNILIDLMGHGPGNRLPVFKNRAAPIQISWMGYCNSSGLDEMDYIVADYNLIKFEEENTYSEKILYLPKIWNSHEVMNEALIIKELPFDKNNYFTFGSFNNFKKISKSVIEVWSEILRQTEGKLILKSSMHNDEELRDKIYSKFSKKILRNHQIKILVGQKEKDEHLKTYNQIDLSLDTFPYNGVTTSFESIWMGVPILTIKGDNFVSRTGESINNNLNLEEFIAKNKDDYIHKAIKFSKKPEKLRELRKSLREKSKNSPLFDTKRFSDEFSFQLKHVWLKKNL